MNVAWFEALTGFSEQDYKSTQRQLTAKGEKLYCQPHGKEYHFGRLLTPTLGQLRSQTQDLINQEQPLEVAEIVDDVGQLHQNPDNAQAVFQVASQFNLLEMVSPSVSPLDGVTDYQFDRTQGPVCAMACGAGTLYRNYLVDIEGQTGQTDQKQLDMLDAFANALNNDQHQYWRMQNGYLMPIGNGLERLNDHLQSLSATEMASLKGRIKVGIQEDTQVTQGDCTHRVSQVYCSALPMAYHEHSHQAWQLFANIVLEAAYEATLHYGLLQKQRTGNRTVYLTLLGGGAFGNPKAWILAALNQALSQFRASGLDVRLVSYGQSEASVTESLSERFR